MSKRDINKANILLVEDDKNLGFILKDYLELLGYSVSLREDGFELRFVHIRYYDALKRWIYACRRNQSR